MDSLPSKLASYHSLFERLSDPILILDQDNSLILQLNPAAERVLGVDADECINRPLGAVLGDRLPMELFDKQIRIAKRNFYSKTFSVSFPGSGGKLLSFEVGIGGLDLSDGREVIQAIFQDVTVERDLLAQLEAAAMTDAMTSLPNYRFFMKQLEQEHARSVREKANYSVVFMDIDNFKHYNDRNGHPAGDRLLGEFAKLLLSAVRTTDTVARYGGEEFAIICPKSVASDIQQVVCTRLLQSIRAHGFEFAAEQPLGHISASIGVASFPDHGETADAVLRAADDAAYVSKRMGRDRISIAGPA